MSENVVEPQAASGNMAARFMYIGEATLVQAHASARAPTHTHAHM